MKSNGFFGFMFNPFTRIAGWQAVGLGLVFVLLTGVIGTFSNVSFDGAIDMHLSNQLTFFQSFSYLAIDIISLVLVMFVTGLFISKGFRFVDIFGTMILAKAPYSILAIAGYFSKSPDVTEILKDPYVIFQSVSFLIIMLFSLPVTIWSIALMYNALKISCGAKGSKLTIAFIIAILVSEIISKILISILL